MDIIASKYNDIVPLFKSRLIKQGIQYDEDLFNDSFIKCADKFGSEQIDSDLAIKYFWTTYINTIKSEFNNNICIESLDEEIHDCIDNTYNEFVEDDYAKDTYNTIMNAITSKYGEEDMYLYSLYKYHEWTEQDLIDAGYDCIGLDKRIKLIHKFVKSYCKKHINKERAK